jgi:photosystem II stability/assembly factor-like uncharacterized protein
MSVIYTYLLAYVTYLIDVFFYIYHMKKILPLLFLFLSGSFLNAQNINLPLSLDANIVDDSLLFNFTFNWDTRTYSLIRSQDRGLSFDTIPSFGTESSSQFDFYNDSVGFSLTSNNIILKTTNRGANWSVINSPQNVSVEKINCLSLNSVIAIGTNDSLYKTINGGESWLTVNTPDLRNYSKYKDLNINANGLGVFSAEINSERIIFLSTDFGENWLEVPNPPDFEHIEVMDNNNIIAMNWYTNEILLSIDSGGTWTTSNISLENDNFLYEMDGNGKIVAAICSTDVNLIIVCSSDYGENWSVNSFSDGFTFTEGIKVTPSNVVYSLGIDDGAVAVYRSENNLDCLSSITSQEIISKKDLIISPNPSTGLFNIALNIDESYSVFNLTGKIVLTSRTKTIDLSNQPSGLYFLRVSSDNGVIKLLKK